MFKKISKNNTVSLLAIALTWCSATAKADENQPLESKTEKTDDNIEIISVTGRPIESYSASDALTGTKSNALLRDLPLTVSIVPQELISDRALSYLGEALDNVSGAQRKQGYGGTQNFGAYLRGFDSSFLTLRNGVRDFGFYTLRDTANVERFEVLKGPGSVLYGALRPGGITNTITKKPVAEPLAEISIIGGSHDRYRMEADLGGALSDSVFFRVNAAAEDADSFRDHVENKGYFLAPVITWQASEKFQWTLELEHKKSEFTWDLGLPANPASFTVPVSRFLGEPDGINDVHSTTVSSTIDYRFNDTWQVRQTTSYAETDGDYKLRSAWRLEDDGRTVLRSAYDTKETSSTFGTVTDFIANFETSGIEHQLVFGVDYYQMKQSYHFDFLSLAPIDLFDPVYGAEAVPLFPLFAERNRDRSVGVYAQDLISLNENWKALVGIRHDWNTYKAIDTLTDSVSRDTDETAFSPQFGIVYQPDDVTSFYASYSKSFLPVRGGATADASPLKPEKGEQFEIGVKRRFFDDKVSATLAVFDITKQNVNTTDPDNPLFIIQTGEQKSRGIELDLSGSPVPGWDMIFGAAYIDAYVSEDNRFAVDSKLPGAADFSASLWNKYTVQRGALEELSFGLGIYYVDKRQVALPNNDWSVPSYTRLDAFVAYPFGKALVQLNVKNLTDETIYDLTSTSILPQEPLSVSLRLSYNFF